MVKKQIFGLILMWSLSSSATSYFVDFVGGNDASAGTSTITAWQHCPGDANATGGPAGVTLNPGDFVNFKLGVTYNSTHGMGHIWNGTAGNPITYQAASGWGSGQAIIDGYHGATTNTVGFEVNGRFCTIVGIVFTNITVQAVGNFSGEDASGLVVSNCVFVHLGGYPYNSGIGGGGNGYGVRVRESGGITVASNLFYDINETAIYNVTTVTNTVIWGNTITNIKDHAIFFGSQGWGLVAFNSMHDQNDPNSHDDNIQLQSWGLNSSDTNAVVVCGNWFWNGNSDTFFNALAGCGKAYIFNNVMINPSSSAGDGQDGADVGILINTQQNLWDSFYIFNNTILLKNASNGGLTFSPRGGANFGTNAFLYNNVVVESLWNEPLGNDGQSVHHTYSGYNVFTNFSRVTYLPAGLSLAAFQAAYPTQEVNSVQGNVIFVNRNNAFLPASDFHLTSTSAGRGTGTNLSSLLPANTFSFLPAVFSVDPTKSSDLVPRGTVWDMGAFQGSVSPPPQRIARVTNLHAGTVKVGP